MLSQEHQMEVYVLQRQGLGVRAIARTLGVSRNTVRTILRGKQAATYGPRKPEATTKLSPYHGYLQQRLSQSGAEDLAGTVLFREVCEFGYAGGLTTLRNYVAGIRPKKIIQPIVRFETEPGDQLQIDFVVFRNGKDPLRAFTASLGYSRMAYAEFVDNERAETWVSCLEHALEAFGGVPKTLLCDNPKTIVIERNAYGDGKHRYHPLFYDFAKHYKIRIRLCKPYRAQTKGKVERFHRYLRESFYHPLETRLSPVSIDMHTANREVRSWLDQVANMRIHATLKERPYDRYLREKDVLTPLPLPYGGQSLRATLPGIPRALMPTPIESLQHPLSLYDEVIMEYSA
jgi:transposase